MDEPRSAVGSYCIGIARNTLDWAAEVSATALSSEQVASLKIDSGEHLALILATAFLGRPPITTDSAGGPDLVFDLAGITGRFLGGSERYADFEVKSLPGSFRAFNATIDRELARKEEPRQQTHSATVQRIDDVLQGLGRQQIEKARSQLARKSRPGHSRNVFLVAHPFDHPYVEMLATPLMAHHLSPIHDADDLDSVWVLLAPDALMVWEREHARWTNLLFDCVDPTEPPPAEEPILDTLQQVEVQFLEHAGITARSPWLFRFETS